MVRSLYDYFVKEYDNWKRKIDTLFPKNNILKRIFYQPEGKNSVCICTGTSLECDWNSEQMPQWFVVYNHSSNISLEYDYLTGTYEFKKDKPAPIQTRYYFIISLDITELPDENLLKYLKFYEKGWCIFKFYTSWKDIHYVYDFQWIDVEKYPKLLLSLVKDTEERAAHIIQKQP